MSVEILWLKSVLSYFFESTVFFRVSCSVHWFPFLCMCVPFCATRGRRSAAYRSPAKEPTFMSFVLLRGDLSYSEWNKKNKIKMKQKIYNNSNNLPPASLILWSYKRLPVNRWIPPQLNWTRSSRFCCSPQQRSVSVCTVEGWSISWLHCVVLLAYS